MEAVPNPAETYTVVLLYPDYLAEQFGEGTFVGKAYAEFPRNAVLKVQQTARRANENRDPDMQEFEIQPEDFRPLAVFRGDCERIQL